jgi:pimeloyl-ACP methyl ester carboxylesterase
VPYKYVSVGGTATYVHHAGPTTLPEKAPDLSRGRTVVCLHGSSLNQAVFDPLFERLAAQHSPVAIDMPGHGRSGGLDSLPSIEAMAKHVHELAGRIGARRPVLLNHSLGGAVALQYASEHPAELAGLVLCGTGFAMDRAALDASIEQTRLVAEGKQRRAFEREAYGPDATPEIMQRGFMEELKTDPRTRLGNLLALRAWPGVDLRRIDVPVLVVCGSADYEVVRESARRLERELPRAKRVEIPGAGHMLPLEKPESLANAVLAFLAELGA